MMDPSERIRIQAGDFILLEYTPLQIVGNVITSNIGALSIAAFTRN